MDWVYFKVVILVVYVQKPLGPMEKGRGEGQSGDTPTPPPKEFPVPSGEPVDEDKIRECWNSGWRPKPTPDDVEKAATWGAKYAFIRNTCGSLHFIYPGSDRDKTRVTEIADKGGLYWTFRLFGEVGIGGNDLELVIRVAEKIGPKDAVGLMDAVGGNPQTQRDLFHNVFALALREGKGEAMEYARKNAHLLRQADLDRGLILVVLEKKMGGGGR